MVVNEIEGVGAAGRQAGRRARALTEKRHFFFERNGIKIYRIYRHGNPRDVFQSYWFRTTNLPRVECHDTDFDVRKFPADLVDTMKQRDFSTVSCRAAIEAAIDRGLIKGGA